MICTPISRGLAFGRLSGVGIDGSLTGLFTHFHCARGRASRHEEEFALVSCDFGLGVCARRALKLEFQCPSSSRPTL